MLCQNLRCVNEYVASEWTLTNKLNYKSLYFSKLIQSPTFVRKQ